MLPHKNNAPGHFRDHPVSRRSELELGSDSESAVTIVDIAIFHSDVGLVTIDHVLDSTAHSSPRLPSLTYLM